MGAIGGLAVDALLGEPPLRWHPVARFGSAMERVERRWYGDSRWRGVRYVAIGVGIGAGTGWGLQRLLGRRAASVVAVAACSAGRMLDGEASAIGRLLLGHGASPADVGAVLSASTAVLSRQDVVGALTERDQLASTPAGDGLATARERLRGLVGRETSQLEAAEISRAVIESVAENGVDAVTASVFWGAMGGAPAVLAHRAINTLDAMVGHRNERYARFGWASARLDDAVNYVPARLTALAVAAVRPGRARHVWRTVRRDAGRHPSPNGGVVESAVAAALGVRLGGTNRYGDEVEDRGILGDGRPAAPADITAAIRLRRDATAALCLALAAVQLAGGRQSRRRRTR